MMQKKDFSFFYKLRVRYSEIDAQGIVFNAHYLTYFDVAVYEYLRALPFDPAAHLQDNNQDFHTVKAVVNFHRPCRFDEELEIGCRVSRIGQSSLVFLLGVFGNNREKLRVSGEIVWVHVDRSANKSTSVPENLARLIRLKDKI